MDPARVLVVQHEVGAPAGWFGDALQDHGCALTVATPYDGPALPPLDDFAGLLVLGGGVDSWDDEAAPWLPATRDLVRRAEVEQVPTLGICLGHQVAAHALGGKPGRNPAGRAVSIEPVDWLDAAAADPMFAPVRAADRAVHWNRDVVLDLPSRAVPLAHSADGAVQAARLGRSVWGIQAHPEVDTAIVATWMEEEWDVSGEAERAVMHSLVEAVRAEEHSLRTAWMPLAASFAGLVGDGSSGR